MNEKQLDAAVLKSFPPVDEEKVDALLATEIAASGFKIVVLDDDPTGVQTVHDISVYTDWNEDSIRAGFMEENKVFYILTNSRGFTEAETVAAHTQIAERVARVGRELDRPYVVISRSDSTLRGHYPLETMVLKDVLEKNQAPAIDGEVLCPYFNAGGRFTINDVHYVKEGDKLTPAGQTEFAKDKTFGYRSSNMKEYIEEKTKGAYPASSVTGISLEDTRALAIDKIQAQLMAVNGFNKVIVNAVDNVDVKVFCIALYRAMAAGKRFMFRTAAGIVKIMGGITDIPLLTRKDMVTRETDKGGIIVVGSHTAKTTAQLEAMRGLPGLSFMEFRSDLVLDEEKFEAEKARVQAWAEEQIEQGMTPVIYTNRRLLVVENDTPEEALVRSVKISDAVQSFVGNLQVTPAFVIAKGGITSSDVGTKALKVRRANVLGQIRPGIPVWQTKEESRFPATPYVIFPGNVGDVDTLREAAQILMEKDQ